MEISDFAYHQPASLAEACRLGWEKSPSVRFLAGGTELLPDLKQHKDSTQHLVSLQKIPGLKDIRMDGGVLRIGSLALLSDIAESPLVLAHFPALSEAILSMAAVQIRNRGTIGGNFCGAVPSADTPPICICGGARVRLVGIEGERTLAAEEFFTGPRRTVLQRGEILSEVLIPAQPQGSGASYERFSLRLATALAVAAVAARIVIASGRIREARVALGAVAPVPMLAVRCGTMLEGKEPSAEVLESAGAAAAEESRPISDLRGSAEFRSRLVHVLTVRALRASAGRALGGEPMGKGKGG